MRGKRIIAVGAAAAVLGVMGAAPSLAQTAKEERLSQSVARDWEEWNPGGAPVSPQFVQAALAEGLTPKQVLQIFESQALGGPQTSATFSSPELLDHFTENPSLIPALLSAVESVRGAPTSYAEYLAEGGTPGAVYRSYNQLLQEAVLGLTGAREAYLSGTSDLTEVQTRIRELGGEASSDARTPEGVQTGQGPGAAG